MEQVWWEGKNVTELKMELKNRGLSTTGKKVELVDRLETDDEQRLQKEEKREGIIRIFAKSTLGTIFEIKVNIEGNLTTLKTSIANKLGVKPDDILLKYPVMDFSSKVGDLQYGDNIYRDMIEESLSEYNLYQYIVLLFSVRFAAKK